MDILDVITDYFGVGGLFNPELMEHDKVSNMVEMARAEITILRAELEKAKKDAERYQWLRHGDNDEKVIQHGPVAKDYHWLPRNERLDEMIDNAMKGNS